MAGEPIGRFGPVSTYGGRTEGQPCVGIGGVCDANDVEAWLQQAKHWVSLAKTVRENVVAAWGSDPTAWPAKVKFGGAAYDGARSLLAGAQGWLDSSKVANAIQVQRYAKTAMELWFQALEQKYGKPLEVDPDGLGYDGLADPENLPPNPPLPDLPGLGLGAGIMRAVGLAVGAYVVVNLLRGSR